MGYEVTLISIQEKEALAERYAPRVQYELKSDVYGCCIKLLTDNRSLRDTWSENLYNMSQNIRSHGRLYVFNDPQEEKDQVFYDPQSKTAFLLNVRYYGWIKSLALSVTGDMLEDEHRIYSVHGACIDTRCGGMCILGGSGAGKTTQTYGLLREPRVRVVSDDWFFARVFGEDILAYGSEKNFYIRADLATVWPEFRDLVSRAELDSEGRGVVDLRWVVGKGRILPLTTVRRLVLLKRDPSDLRIDRRTGPEEALEILEQNSFFNPHFLVRNEFKTDLRMRFFRELLARTEAYIVNTTGSPEETQRIIQRLAHLDKQ
ncbi:MAG: aldolase [Methanomicrobiales archaeon]|nr:aldolase [Methanomicrobiales archaeon]